MYPGREENWKFVNIKTKSAFVLSFKHTKMTPNQDIVFDVEPEWP